MRMGVNFDTGNLGGFLALEEPCIEGCSGWILFFSGQVGANALFNADAQGTFYSAQFENPASGTVSGSFADITQVAGAFAFQDEVNLENQISGNYLIGVDPNTDPTSITGTSLTGSFSYSNVLDNSTINDIFAGLTMNMTINFDTGAVNGSMIVDEDSVNVYVWDMDFSGQMQAGALFLAGATGTVDDYSTVQAASGFVGGAAANPDTGALSASTIVGAFAFEADADPAINTVGLYTGCPPITILT